MSEIATRPSSAAIEIPRLHLLLGVQSVVIVLVSINRLSRLSLGFVADNQFLRWVDFNNMLVLPLISMTAFYLLIRHLEYDSPVRNGRPHLAVNLIFLIGVYLLAAGYGNHEVTNYLHARFCPPGTAGDLCPIVIFNDDEFSHWVFFAGFVLVNTAILFLQVLFPALEKLNRLDRALLVLNGLFIAAGVFANLAFETIGADLYIIALLATLSLGLLIRRGAQPMFVYYSTAYGLGLAGTAIFLSIQ